MSDEAGARDDEEGPPTLIGERVIVRRARPSDAADRLAAGYSLELTRAYGGDPRERRTLTPSGAAGWQQSLAKEPFAWAIEHDGRCIGSVRLHSFEWSSRAARLAIGLFAPDTWGRGLGSEAIRLVLRCAFEGYGLHRVGLRVLDSNPRAIRAYEKCGFVREGHERETVFMDGVWHGDVIMGCLDRDFWALHGADSLDDPTDLQRLFESPILEQRRAVPEAWDGSSHLRFVRTSEGEACVRWSGVYGWKGWSGELPGPAQWGANRLFGVDTRRVFDLAPAHALLRRLGGVPVPRLVSLAMLNRWQCAVVEWMPGAMLTSYADLSDEGLRELGVGIARQHGHRERWCGNLRGTHRTPLNAFHDEAVATARALVPRYFGEDTVAQRELEPMCAALASLPDPADASPLVVDHGADQYLAENGRVTALVDLEMLVLAPRALDLVALELEMDERAARAFRAGYVSVAPLPDLAAVRRPYRFLMALLIHHGERTLDHWLDYPAHFDAEAAEAD
jgi:RimJ/RimL family protein N-acetyltransferase